MRHLLGIIIILAIGSSAYAQQVLINPASSKKLKANTQLALKSLINDPTIQESQVIQFNLEALKSNDEIAINFFNKSLTIKPQHLEVRAIRNLSWTGLVKEHAGNVLISMRGQDIQGTIIDDTDIYEIHTLNPGNYAIVRIDQTQFPLEDCGHLDLIQSPIIHPQPQENIQELPENDISTPSLDTDFATTSHTPCKIRVLILFTPRAEARESDMFNLSQLAIDLTNQAFINSNVKDVELELVYVGRTEYTERDRVTDLNFFRNKGDGIMDEVHELRDAYAADICVLINNDSQVCGRSTSILANEEQAFCLVHYSCIKGNFSFAHEIGHLLGCRHDPYADRNTEPFPYGHGYVSLIGRWRTLMAYNRECQDNGLFCARLLYWSNPNIQFNGLAMGTDALSNSARTTRETRPIALGWRQPQRNTVLQIEDLGSQISNLFGDVLAQDSIASHHSGDEPVVINAEQTITMRAGKHIRLSPGFKVERGAHLQALVQQVDTCTDILFNQFANNQIQEDGLEDQLLQDFDLSIYPNPAQTELNLKYSLHQEEQVQIEIKDFLGNPMQTLLEGERQMVGLHQNHFDISSLAPGIYFVSLRHGGQVKVTKLIIQY